VVAEERYAESKFQVLRLTFLENVGKIGKVEKIGDKEIFGNLKNFLLTQENKTGKLGKLAG
jgi:hypothetical protein